MANEYYFEPADGLTPERPQSKFWIGLFLVLSLLACTILSLLVPSGLGFIAGYGQLQEQNHENAIQHFQRGLGYLAENYPELAYTEFEIAVRYDPAYDPARQKLQEMQGTMAASGTPGAQEENRVAQALYDEARDLIANKEWNDAINRLEQLRALNSNVRVQETGDLLFQAYAASGKEAVASGQIELARERFDSALTLRSNDPEVLRQRDLAVLYLDGQQAVGYNWQLAIQKFAALYQQDPTYDDVKTRLVDAYTQYGDVAMKQNAWCLAAREYDGALAITKDATVSDRRNQAMSSCRQVVVSTPTPAAATGAENYIARVSTAAGKACTGTGDVSGVVRDALNNLIAGVSVAYYADGINRVTTRTNVSGQYQFTWGADPGLMHVVVLSADGKTPAGVAADVQYPGGNKPGCHIVVDWQKVQ